MAKYNTSILTKIIFNMQANRRILITKVRNGFTLVEVMIVIAVIGILATITFVSYKGITQKAITASILSDLKNATDQLKLFKLTYRHYPTTTDCSVADSSTNLCLKSSSGNVYFYTSNLGAKTFGLTAVHGGDDNLSYRSDGVSAPVACPVGYIIIPGSKTYGTSDFCVMKYEAKDDGMGKPVSKYNGDYLIWYSQNDAKIASSESCDSCHLITEAEWMTIVQNVANNDYNWSGGSVGVGYLFNGHSDYDPYGVIPTASQNDSDAYFGTNDVSPSSQRRTFVLSNGEVIWDFSGNLSEWTSDVYDSGQPGINGGGFDWRDYVSITSNGSLAVNPMPSGTGINNAINWTMSDNKIGEIYSDFNYNSEFGIRRGGNWLNSGSAGIFAANMSKNPDSNGSDTGFRVSR